MDNGSPAGLHAIRPVPTSFSETPPGVASETSEELAERDEAPAPLPPRGVTPCHRSDVSAESVSVVDGLVATMEDATLKNSPVVNNGGKGLYAKDKRKIREKRRSTGIAKFNASEVSHHFVVMTSMSFFVMKKSSKYIGLYIYNIYLL